MDKFKLVFKPFGPRAILIQWPRLIDESVLSDILRFRTFVHAEYPDLEIIPAYNSLTLISSQNIDHSKLKEQLQKWYAKDYYAPLPPVRTWELPVCYDTSFGLDLEVFCKAKGISKESLVEMHTKALYTIYAIGFLPGFMYLGGLPEKLHHPRRSSPRLEIPKGSVGIGGEQTGVYPQVSPGGWNIIGNCPVQLFHPEKEKPLQIRVGDKLRFKAIDKDTHSLYVIQSQTGIYELKSVSDDQSN